MIQSAAEIKTQILKEANNKPEGAMSTERRSQFIELGIAVKRMAGTKGWKIVEAWLLRKLDVGELLSAKPDQLPFVQAKAQAFAEVIRQVNYWITLAEQLEEKGKDGPV
jgi:hypothetical protein